MVLANNYKNTLNIATFSDNYQESISFWKSRRILSGDGFGKKWD